MKKIFYAFLAGLFLTTFQLNAQVTFDFASATQTAAPIGYQEAGVGTYYRSTSGGTISDNGANCDGFTPAKTTSSSIFIFVATSDVTKITVRGNGTGSNRTFSAMATSATLNGTYTADAGAVGTGTISGSTCGAIEITPSATITAGTYMRFTFSGNLNITSIVLNIISGNPPTVTTDNPVATSVTENSATLGGAITDIGTSAVTVSGVCYGLTANPTILGTKTTDGPTAVGTISSSVSGLSFSTTYHVRAYATNSFGTSYGADETFTTSAPSSPTILALPTPLNFGAQLQNTPSAEKIFTITAGGLTPASGDITITAPTGYQVSSTSGSGFASSINVPYTLGGIVAPIYVVFTPTALVSYTGDITVSGGGATTVNVAVNGSGTDVAFETGDYKSVATGNWDVTTTWNKWDGSAWIAAPEYPNSQTANVYIVDGFTVTKATSGRSVKNLYIDGNSFLKSNNLVNSPVYVRVYGTTVDVKPGSRIGNLLDGNNADGISLDLFGTNVTITGGGTINLSRIRTNTASTTVTINTDVLINYHGSGNAGNAAGYYNVAGEDNILTINAGKTLTFAPWSCFTPVSSSHTNGTFNQTVNVNGTLTFVDGLVPGNATANGWSGHTNGYFSFGAAAGKIFNLNIGSTGTMNVSEFYPNGTKADNTIGTGDIVAINIAAGGALNVSKIADFRNATQTVTGAGAFNLGNTARMRIGSVDGITASAAAGPIQTTTRGFSTGVYAYEGIAAQVSGDGTPAFASGLIINNATGLTLTKNISLADSLNLTNGVITSTASEMITLEPGASVNGGSNASHVSGPITKQTAFTVAFSFPIGKGGVYRPASVTPADASISSYTAEYFNTSGASTSSVASPLTSVGTNEYWDIARNSGANASVSLNYDNTITTTWSNAGAPDATQEICVAHFNSGTWYDEAGTTGTSILGDVTTGTVTSQELSAFSPFTFGLKPQGTVSVKLSSFNATLSNGNTKLVWSTNNEDNVATYSVEKSVDGRNFVTIANQSAFNQISNNYNFTDQSINAGVVYYRLRIVDKAGKVSYSSTIAVNNKNTISLSVFPNPVASNLYVSHKKASEGAKLEIYSLDGRKINEYKVVRDAIQSTINASTLSKGNYSLILIDGDTIQHTRFIKQ